MASNLRQKLPAEDSLLIYDTNEEAAARLQKDQSLEGRIVEVAASAREAAGRSVCRQHVFAGTERIFS